MSNSSAPFTIRRMQAQDWQAYRETRLRSLADSPDAFCSTLAAEQARSDDAWASRIAAASSAPNDYPLIAEIDGMPSGLVWAQVDSKDNGVVNLYQMWVAPEQRGKGIAAALLREAVHWATSTKARVVKLGVTCGDTAAVRLYARAGFVNDGAAVPMREGTSLMMQNLQLWLDGLASTR